MERIKRLNSYQKGILLVMILMTLIFAVLYAVTITRVGYRYKGAILVLKQQDGNAVYSGKIDGTRTQFIVSKDQSVVLQHGDATYGPYTMKEDPAAIPSTMASYSQTTVAIPSSMASNSQITGVEIRNGNSLLFRGGVLALDGDYWFYKQDGSLANFDIIGSQEDVSMEPSLSTIYELLRGPELTHRGKALAWFGAVFFCVLNALSILFADELFKWGLSFRIQNPEAAEPSNWEIAERYIGWTGVTVAALGLFVVGLL